MTEHPPAKWPPVGEQADAELKTFLVEGGSVGLASREITANDQ